MPESQRLDIVELFYPNNVMWNYFLFKLVYIFIMNQKIISKNEMKLKPRNKPSSPPMLDIKSTIVIRKFFSYSKENI